MSMLGTRILSLVGVALFALSPAISEARPQQQVVYYTQDGRNLRPQAIRQKPNVRWHIPFAQWNDDVQDEQPVARARTRTGAVDQRYWYVPAPQAERGVRQYASIGTEPAGSYYADEPSYYQPAPQPQQAQPQQRRARVMDPRYQRQVVAYDGSERPGTVIIDTNNKFLYLVMEGGQALRYGVGVGRPGFEWSGVKAITRKAEWPDWTPPDEMLKRRPDLPRFMPGGPQNPLGARAMYLGSSLYRIHGTNEPHTIGTAVSSGCIRMVNDDVMDLYNRVRVGTRVIVI